MRQLSLLSLAICLPMLIGCEASPFSRGTLPIIHQTPTELRQQFAASIPERFVSDDTIIIHAPFHQIAVLSVARIDRQAGTFRLVALNQLGVELFTVSGNQQTLNVDFAIPPLDQQKTLLLAIAEDVRRIYFDLLPSPKARTEIHRQFIRYTQQNGQGVMIYELGGDRAELLEKRFAGFFGTIWRAQYFDYTSGPGGLYPRGIVLDNNQFFYRIIVKNRDWQAP